MTALDRAALLAVVSAFAGTTHEVVWSHSVGRLVGNTTWAVTLTLAFFMVGMGVGSVWGHRLLSRAPLAPRVAYAVAELAIALTALAAHAVFLEAEMPSALLGLSGGAGLGLDVTVGSVLLLVPATAMGATYPLLLRAVPDLRGRAASLIYAAGLVGGVVGVLAAAAWIAPLMGLRNGYQLAVAINVAVAAAALVLLGRRAEAEGAGLEEDRVPERGGGPVGLTDGARVTCFAAAAAAGMGAQVVWNRAVAPFAGVSTFTFAAIVAVHLVSQAIAFRVFHARSLGPRAGAWALVLLPFVLAPSVLVPALASGLVPERSGDDLAFAGACLAVVAGAAGLPAFLTGLAHASALSRAGGEPQHVASRAGRVVGLGTLCGALVALLTGFVLVPALGPWRALVLLGAGAASAAGLVVLRDRRRLVVAALVPAAALAFVQPPPGAFLGPGLEEAKVLWLDHGVEDTTAVVEIDHPLEGRVRRIVTNGVSYSGDSIAAQRYMRLLAHLPALAARRRERALVICVGTGTTVGSLARHPFERIDAVDISANVLEATAHFSHVNRGLHDPRVRRIVADGHRFLRSPGERYDVITLEPPPPRAPGGSVLYGLDFYVAARGRLRDGGVVAQWLPLHGMTAWEVDRLVATFLEAFPEGRLYLAERNEAILLGSTGPLPDVPDEAALREPEVRAELDRLGLGGRSPLSELEVGGPDVLGFVTRHAEPVRFAWPAPEYAPFSVPTGSPPLDAWLAVLAERASRADGEPTYARAALAAAPSFARVKAGSGTAADKEEVLAKLLELLREEPRDPYLQYVFGYGPLLEARLDRLAAQGVPQALLDATRARHREQAAWARALVDER